MSNTDIQKFVEKWDVFDNSASVPDTIAGHRAQDKANFAAFKTDLEAVGGKQVVLDYFRSERERKSREYAERQQKIAAIEGLSEMEQMYADNNRWHVQFDKMMDNDGCFPQPTATLHSDEEMTTTRKKYPRATAYLKAERMANKSHYEYAAIGRDALERIINGEDYALVLTDMEKAENDITTAHMWD